MTFKAKKWFVIPVIAMGICLMNSGFAQEDTSEVITVIETEENGEMTEETGVSEVTEVAAETDNRKKSATFNHEITTDFMQILNLTPSLKYEFVVNRTYGVGIYLASNFDYFFDIGMNFNYYIWDYGYGKLCGEAGIIFSTEKDQPLETPLLFSLGTRVRLPFLPELVVKPTFGVLIPLNEDPVAAVLQINLGYEF